ncbi:hypothetical protein [Streptomyces lydicus]|uniref:hypothetical protein n=1 Tax=Streptomyces lydicus TaxID=47763 RepID=UPI001F5114B4|nr:hypothetical protein [Streptomyces lydicus]MCZ1011030.1 hypothetical protein [Streptomyces lydicus]
MNQQYPDQPGQQPPMPVGMYAPPPPPKKRSAAAKIGIGCGGAFGALVLIGIVAAALGGSDATTRADEPAKPGKTAAPAKGQAKEDAKAAGVKPKGKSEEKPKEKPEAAPESPADRFKAFVVQHGSANEKAAIAHVTKVQGAEEQNDILDSVDIYTDFTGGLLGPHQSEGKLIASAFADWKTSRNGLVTIYDAKGEMLANGNF